MTKPTTAAAPSGTSARPCSTHYHACDCREARLYAVLRGVADDLSKSADATAFQAYIDINEMWIELYGHEILSNKRLS
jgi:hypothetical protein